MHGNAAAAAMQNSASSGSLGPPPTQSPPSVPSVHAERYRLFRSLVAKQSFGFDGGAWTFFDHGPREDKIPLVLLPAVTGSAAGFFHVLLTLGARGRRCIAAHPPPASDATDIALGLDALLDHLAVARAHVYGDGLGALFALRFAERRPRRVASLLLCNGFCTTAAFDFASALLGDTWLAHAGCTLLGEHVFRAVPEFMIKHCLLKRLPQGAVAVPLADAVDFHIEHELEPIKHDELCARLALQCAPVETASTKLPLSAELVTVIRTMDCAAVPLALHDLLMARISGAKYAPIKTGGDFPHLASHQELALVVEASIQRVERRDDADATEREIAE